MLCAEDAREGPDRPVTTIETSRVMTLRAELLGRSEALRAAAPPAPTAASAEAAAPGFGDALREATRLQEAAGAASEAWERGETADIAGVMIARQKAAVAFETTLQVRNKLLGAYRDVMNMSL